MASLALPQFRCPCCSARTLKIPDAMQLCPVCWWEDDGQDSADADSIHATVNGDLSLEEARRNFLRFGASHPRFVRFVRQPNPEER